MLNYEPGNRLGEALESLISLVEAENKALRIGEAHRILEYQARKSMILFDIGRFARFEDDRAPVVMERLGRARALLDVNRSLLDLNIKATAEVLHVLRSHDLNDCSDGTYSSQGLFGGGHR